MRFAVLLVFILCAMRSDAYVWPEEGASLHYRLIGFSFPAREGATAYKLEVSQRGGKKVVVQVSGSNRLIATVPAFGQAYSWRVLYMKKKKVIDSTPVYHFSVLPNPYIDNSNYRVHVIDTAQQYKDLLVFFDNTRCLHNMKGEALWFLPVIPGITDTTFGMVRDLKLTPQGTITVLTTKNVHELDYNGNVLWSGPNDGSVSGDSTDQYHHEFTKMPDSTYWVIGNKMMHPHDIDKNVQDGGNAKTPCGTIIQYNARKEVLWTWNSCEHISMGDPTTHFNSFYFDRKNKVVYSSYRNISRVIKAAYPSGRVLAQYGQSAGDAQVKGNGVFYSLHNVGINSNGDLHLFNNNFIMGSADPKANDKRASTIVVFKEPAASSDSLVKLWEFSCDIDTFAGPIASGGGSLCELDKGDYLVCAGITGRSFIVSADKRVLWNVVTEKREQTWKPFAGYRVSPVWPGQLHRLLFRQ